MFFILNSKLLNSRCSVKYSMIILNFFFVISGIILLFVGKTIRDDYLGYQHFLNKSFLSVPMLFIAVGTSIFCIAFFGCYIGVKETYYGISMFALLMVLVFILELASGISGYVLRNEAQEVVREKMLETLPKYHANGSEIFNMWDQLQADFHCCGVDGAEDWVKHLVTNNSEMPMSCCLPQNGIIGEATCNVNSTNLYHAGCLTKFVSFIGGHAVQLGGVGLGIAYIQSSYANANLYLATLFPVVNPKIIGMCLVLYLRRIMKRLDETNPKDVAPIFKISLPY